MTKSWNEIKKTYKLGVFAFAFFTCFTFIMAPTYRQDLSQMTLTLAKKPVFKVKHSKGTSYWLELWFEEKEDKYEISGIDYKYLNYNRFKDSVKTGDKVSVHIKDDNIFSLSKNGFEYMNFGKAQFHKGKNRLFGLWFSLTGLICCIIPLFYKSRPTINILGRTINIKFNWILIISLTIAFLILSKNIGFNYVSADEFAK